MKSNTFKEYIQPSVVLVAICLVITFALAYVNSITSPIIAENTRKAADEARTEVLLPAAISHSKNTQETWSKLEKIKYCRRLLYRRRRRNGCYR